jgi:hypothetical protein
MRNTASTRYHNENLTPFIELPMPQLFCLLLKTAEKELFSGQVFFNLKTSQSVAA